jgi:hypothetical protein
MALKRLQIKKFLLAHKHKIIAMCFTVTRSEMLTGDDSPLKGVQNQVYGPNVTHNEYEHGQLNTDLKFNRKIT